MIQIKKKILFHWLLFLSACTSISMQSQEAQRYQGPLAVNKYIGEADYGYKIVNGDTLLNGAFQIQRSNLESLLEKEDYSFLFKGNFSNNYPTGQWNFQFGEYQSNRQSQVVDYQYRVLVSGTQEDADGFMQEGRPQGLWTYTVNQIKDSEVEKLLFKSSITFENGVPQRSFQIENERSTLVGRFLRNGLAHDQWSLFTTDGIDADENWFFNDGLLQKIEVNESGTIRTIRVYGSNTKQSKTIRLDLRYINALQLHLEATNSDTLFSQGVHNMLTENATYYQKIDTILSELGESDFAPKFKVKVPYFPLDSVETTELNSIKTLHRKSERISNEFLNNTQLNILKLADEEAFFQYEVIKSISKNFLNPIGKMLQYDKQGILEFVEMEVLLKNLWPKGMPSKTIEVKTDSIGTIRVFELEDSESYGFKEYTLVSANQLSKYAQASIDSIQKILNDKLTKEQRQNELIALEENLILQNKELNRLMDSTNANAATSNSAKEALRQIKAYEDKKLAEYSGINDVEAKLHYARQLVDCYSKLQSLAETIAALPTKWQTIQENYQDRVWNPFMATLMDEEVKKRITTAYRKVLVPYFLEQVKTNTSCENAENLVNQMKGSYQRVLQLRGEDTAKLERKLRKEQDPQVVMQLFNLKDTDQN